MLKHLSGSAQLLAMKLQENPAQRPLIIGPSEPGWPSALRDLAPRCAFLYSDFAVYSQDLKKHNADPASESDLLFADIAAPPTAAYDRVIVVLPKGKESMRAEFSQAAQCVEPGGTAWVVGPKKGGIASVQPLVEQYLGPIIRSSGARHAKLLEVERVQAGAIYEDLRSFEVQAFGHHLRVCSLPGVFSHGRLDAGTEFLLANLPTPSDRSALDMGCGNGVIGAALQIANPESTVHFVDSAAAALAATRHTLKANNLEADGVWASNLFDSVDERYDLIITNPPFHQGFSTNFGVTNRLIKEAQLYLKPSGRLVLVANRFIDYFRVIRPIYAHVTVLAENTKFRVIEAQQK